MMDLNLYQLRTFLGVVRYGSFAAAARHLCITQSAVSVRIQELEQMLNAKLFTRGHQRVTLTPNGRALVPCAEHLLDIAARIPNTIGTAQLPTGVIRIGACEPITLTWFSNLIAAIRKNFPQVGVEADTDLTPDLLKKLRDGELDIAFAAGPTPSFGYEVRPLGKVSFIWIAGPQFAAQTRVFGKSDICRLPLLSLSKQPYEYPVMEKWLAEAEGHRYSVVCNDLGVLIRLLLDNVGVALLPDVCCRQHIAQGGLVALRTSPPVPPVEFFAVWRKTKHHPLISAIGELAAQLSGFHKHG